MPVGGCLTTKKHWGNCEVTALSEYLFIYLMLNGEKKHQGSAGNLHQQPTYCKYKIIYNYTMFDWIAINVWS